MGAEKKSVKLSFPPFSLSRARVDPTKLNSGYSKNFPHGRSNEEEEEKKNPKLSSIWDLALCDHLAISTYVQDIFDLDAGRGADQSAVCGEDFWLRVPSPVKGRNVGR